ncbi:MAG: DEAD/DEAH box helicase [Eubacteriales bacterium]
MNRDQSVFERFPDYIREYIYRHSWEDLREIQLLAADSVFNTQNNLLLTSSTASGKTEAAFFPILTVLDGNLPESIAVLYIAPLKSLINDQFGRIEELLDISGIPVTHWHGDVAQSHKKKLLEKPRGILQITPESLESMLMNRSNDIVRLFHGLEFVVIDEIHTLTGTDRGNQIICQLCRMGRLIGHHPRRIGLSATVGDTELAAAWLGAGSGRDTDVPELTPEKLRWRLGMEHFYIQNDDHLQADQIKTMSGENKSAQIDAGYEYMYDCVRDKKSIVFSNSREETEFVTATLRQIAKNRGDKDIFLIHHGNLSASIREEAEQKMKDDDVHAVTCATVTMELGIDIGKLERVVQNSSPNSVSSLLQRLGRSGRRGQPPEMMLVFREENPLPNTPLPQLIPWELLRAIAIVQLYIEERFIEPPRIKKLPFSLAFHQTLSILASSGELTPRALAERVLGLPPFSGITKDDYKTLMISMIENDYIEMTDEKGLIVGLAGERLISSFKFYAVFKDSEDFTVRHDSEEIGTITTPPPVGDRFALAGRVWEVEELDIARKLIYVKPVEGKMEVSWPGDYGEIHTRILQRMRKVLEEDTVYPYLKPNAAHRLEVARHLARNTGMLEHSIVHLGGYSWCVFPWLGTRSFRTFRKFLAAHAAQYRISGIEHEAGAYITFKMEQGNDYILANGLADEVTVKGIDSMALVGQGESPVFDKYDEYLPASLLQKAYAADKLSPDEAAERFIEIFNEY